MRTLYTKLLAVLIITFLGIIVYSNTFDCSFHYDDTFIIINDPFIKNIHDLLNIWKCYPCRFITFLSIAINYHFNGLNVFGYHLFNLAVHLISAFLIWWLVLLTFSTPTIKKDEIARHADLIALFTGLVFVSHPVQTEAVTYIWQRAASMAALFYLASLCFYVKSRLLQPDELISEIGHPPTGHSSLPGKFFRILSLIFAIAAMFTKENTVTLPLMILLYEFYFFKTKKSLNWKAPAPLLFTLLIIPVTMLLTKTQQFQAFHDFVARPKGISALHYLLTQFRGIVTYIRLVLLPLNQNMDYDYPLSKSIFETPTLVSCLLLTAVLYWAKCLFSKYRLVSFSILWFFLTLLPESSLLTFKDLISEHRLYLPLAGYSVFLVSCLYYLFISGPSSFFKKNGIKTMVVLLTMIITVNSILTYQRNKIWKNEITLWTDAVRKSPNKARPYYGLGVIYTKQGDLSQAFSLFNKAIKIDPKYIEAYNGRGNLYTKEGDFTQALSDYNKAIEINPMYWNTYYNLGIFYDKQGYFIQALSNYNKTLKINPESEEAYYNRANDHAQHGDFTQAISDYTKAIALDPHDAKAYSNCGNIYSMQGNLTRALSDYNKAISINPNDAGIYSNRAVVYYQLKDYAKAWNDVQKAKSLGAIVNPNFINALKKM